MTTSSLPLRAPFVALAALSLPGCSLLFDPGEEPASDGGRPADASAAAGDGSAPDALPCSSVTVGGTLEADAELDMNTAAGGQLGVVQVDSGPGSVGVFRFHLGGLPEEVEVVRAEVEFPYAASADECGSSCDDCFMFERAGPLDLYAMRSDWSEEEVSWTDRAEGAGWDASGAAGSEDRSFQPVGMATHAKGAATTVSVGKDRIQELLSWRTADNDLSVLLAPGEGTSFLIASRELPNQGCSDNSGKKASMRLRYCLEGADGGR